MHPITRSAGVPVESPSFPRQQVQAGPPLREIRAPGGGDRGGHTGGKRRAGADTSSGEEERSEERPAFSPAEPSLNTEKLYRAMWWWLSWGAEEPYRGPCRTPSEAVCDTLMLELAWQCKEAERMHRERESQFQRLRSGVDYSWLVSAPRSNHSLSTGERLGLEDLCLRIPPSHCGLVILKFREAMQTHEPEVQEVSGLFRSALLQTLEQVKEEQEAQRLTQQWSSHKRSVSLVNFRSRLRINPFGSTVGLTSAVAGDEQGVGLSDLKTVSQDVERGTDRSQRVWSMPDFMHQGNSSKVL